MYIQVVLVIIALVAILLWLVGGYKQTGNLPSLPAILLAAWIIASAVFGSAYFVFKLGLFDLTIERLLFSMMLFFLAAGLLKGNVRFQTNTTIEIAMLSFSLVCVFSMIQHGFVPVTQRFISPWFVFISAYLFPFFVFVFAKNYISSERDVTLILNTLFYFGIYLSITAFFEHTNLRQLVFPRYINDFEIGIHIDRARGPFLNAAFDGVGILIGFISGLHLLQSKTGFAKVFHQAALLLFFPAVFFTLTRSVYLGMLITLFIFLGWYKTPFSKWKLISLPLAVVLIFGVINSPRLLSKERREGGVAQVEEVEIRLALLRRSFFMIREDPLMGVGLAQFTPATMSSYKGPITGIEVGAEATIQHSHLVGMTAELGIVGVLPYLTLIILIIRQLKQLAGKLPATGIMGDNLRVTILAIWCVYLNNNLFVEPSSSIFTNAVPFLFAGLAAGLYTRSVESALLSPSPTRISRSPLRMVNSHV